MSKTPVNNDYLNSFTAKYLNVYMLFPAPNILINNHNDLMSNFLDDIFFNELKRLVWQVIHFWKASVSIFNAVISLILEIEDEAVDEYIIIMSTKVAYGTDTYVQTC